jgi:hypothetical protein
LSLDHLRLSTRLTLIAAFIGRYEAHWIALLEVFHIATNLCYPSGCFMAHGNWILIQRQASLVRLKVHDIAVAKRRRCNFDEKLVGLRGGNRNGIQVDFVVSVVISDFIVSEIIYLKAMLTGNFPYC